MLTRYLIVIYFILACQLPLLETALKTHHVRHFDKYAEEKTRICIILSEGMPVAKNLNTDPSLRDYPLFRMTILKTFFSGIAFIWVYLSDGLSYQTSASCQP